LTSQKRVEPLLLHLLDERRVCAERALIEKTRCVFGSRSAARQRWGRRGSRHRLRATGKIEEAEDFAGRIIRGVNVEIGAARFDRRNNVRDRIRADRNKRPQVSSIGPSWRCIDIEQNSSALADVSRAVNVNPGDWGR